MKRDTFINTCIFISLIYCINYSVTNFLNKNAYDLELEEISLIKKEKSHPKNDDNNTNDNNTNDNNANDKNVNEINMDENANDKNVNEINMDENVNDNNVNDNNVNEINMDENVNDNNVNEINMDENANDNNINEINMDENVNFENADAEIINDKIVNADIVNDMNIMDTLIVKVENNIKKRLDKKTKLLLLQDNLNSIKQKLEMLKNELRNNEF